MKIKLIRFRDDLILPTRAHYNDVGMDVYVQDDLFIEEGTQSLRIPLGFGLEIPTGYAGYIYPKSSHATNGILCELAPIDPGYRGEIHAIVTKQFQRKFGLKRGRKIGQLVILPIVYPELVENLGDERADGGFGSTGL